MKEVKLFLNYAGFCFAKENHSIRGGANKEIKFQTLFGLIFHPEQGWILYDTGYTKRFYEITKTYPNKIYSKITRVVVNEADEVKSQLKHFNLVPSDIKHVFITHFHADHIGGLKDFESATFYCSKAAYRQMIDTRSFLRFTRGILNELIPDDFKQRLKFVEDMAIAVDDEIFGIKYDLFGDQSLFVYNLPGHATGQLGLQVKTNRRNYFLIADACWNKKSYQNMVLPSPIVRLIFDSWTEFKKSLKKVHEFHLQFPEVMIVPTHCSDTTIHLVSDKFDIHAL